MVNFDVILVDMDLDGEEDHNGKLYKKSYVIFK
jgi:hypothetical protein